MAGHFTVRPPVIVLAGVILALFGLLAAFQYFAERADMRRVPPPGRMVDIGGRRLHLLCAGTAPGPLVVIEAGSGDDVTSWQDMVRRLAGFARVCAYDRAGLGWSDPVSVSGGIDGRAEDLHALMRAAGLDAPLVLVAHSFGGYVVRRFAALYPAEVAGMVLIDATEEEFSYAPEGLAEIDMIRRAALAQGWGVRLGLTRVLALLRPAALDPINALRLRTSGPFAVADEMASLAAVPDGWRRVHGFGGLGARPLVVVSRALHDPVSGAAVAPEWQEAQSRLAGLSRVSTHVFAARSGHVMQFDEPGVIVRAVRDVLDELNARSAR